MGVYPSPNLYPSPSLFPTPLLTPSALKGEPEIDAGRRCFATAQQLLAGSPIAPAQTLNIGWHSSSVNAESGSFAVVSSAQEDLVGEIVSVTFAGRRVFAYVLEVDDVPVDLSVTRRLFLALNRLTLEALPAAVAVTQ